MRWGPDSHDPLLFLHGFADARPRLSSSSPTPSTPRLPLLAIDWRGFGASARSPGGYWFPDYYADLEADRSTRSARAAARASSATAWARTSR